MNRKLKRISIAVAILCTVAVLVLVLFGETYILKNRPTHVSNDFAEASIDKIVESLITSEPNLKKKVLFESEDSAREYARILYKENYEYFEEWDSSNNEIWVKHYEEHGIWLAMPHEPGEYLDGPPWIIFKDGDGRVMVYAN